MSIYQHTTLEDTVYFWFAANDTSGSGGDGATPFADVREAGAAASAIPTLSPTPALLSHANYPAGCYEVAVAATAANGFSADKTYAVFCTLAIDSQNPTGFIGSFSTFPVVSDLIKMGGVAQSATDLKDFADAGYDPATNQIEGVKTADVTTTNTDMVTEPPTAVQNRQEMDSNSTKLALITAARMGALTDWINGGRLDLLLDAIKAVTDLLPDGGALTTIDTKLDDIQGATFSSATDSLEAIRNRGDVAWITGGGGGITDILNVIPLIPYSLDLANTATVRIGLMLFNALDDLPSTAEITPGTISIERKAIGGTSWSAVVTDAAMSEIAGLVYYDEVFDTGSGYAEGDTLRITFKSVKITVAANDYEVVGTTGRMFYTEVRQSMRGTNLAALASNYTAARAGYLDNINGHTPQTGDTYGQLPTNFSALSISAGGLVDILQAAADKIWLTATRALTDKSGFALSSAGNQAVWDVLTSALVAVGSIGKLLVDLAGDLAVIKTKTDNLPDGIKKNTALSNFSFFMVDSIDKISAKTGLTVTAQRSIDGAAFAGTTNSPTELGNGVYLIDLSAADLNGDVITLKLTSTGAIDRVITIKTDE